MKKQYLCEVLFLKDAPFDTWTNIALKLNAHRYPTSLKEATSIMEYALSEYNSNEYPEELKIVDHRIRVRSVTPWKIVNPES